MEGLVIRPIEISELPLMERFLYLAIYQRDENNLLPFEIIYDSTIIIYIEDWGRPDDNCLVAVKDGIIIGMVWTRILNGNVKGFGNIDSTTPEFSISILKEYRNQGVGSVLMRNMLRLLKEKGYQKASIAVQKDNYAFKMYQAIGFQVTFENQQEYIMVCDLSMISES